MIPKFPTILLLSSFVFLNQSIAYGSEEIKCTNGSGNVVSIKLNDRKQFGHKLNCIAGDFIEDLTPCAPNRGYGLSYPTGNASLSKLVFRWQDYGDHMGGVTRSNVSASAIEFEAGFMGPQGFHQSWVFNIDRFTGDAKLVLYPNEMLNVKGSLSAPKTTEISFKCTELKKHF